MVLSAAVGLQLHRTPVTLVSKRQRLSARCSSVPSAHVARGAGNLGNPASASLEPEQQASAPAITAW
jgi:hypothetical protein